MTTFAFDASGRVKPPTAELLAEADGNIAILAYSHGEMQDGRPYYAYLAVKPSLYEEFSRRSAARETFPLGQYGMILASDFATGPTPEVITYMHDVYGFDEKYERNLEQEIKLQQDAFMKAEDKRLGDIASMLKKKNQE
jgi:hypothetical protein